MIDVGADFLLLGRAELTLVREIMEEAFAAKTDVVDPRVVYAGAIVKHLESERYITAAPPWIDQEVGCRALTERPLSNGNCQYISSMG